MITEDLHPLLQKSFEHILGPSSEDHHWKIILDDADPDKQTLLFEYPKAPSALEHSYIRGIVRLEMGARSDHWPATIHKIMPYAAEEFPHYFEVPNVDLKVLSAKRTFWDKAIILHREYNRPQDKPTSDRVSRHYYDLYKLSQAPIADEALQDFDLLNQVVGHQKIFFRRGWANYEDANTGQIHLVPNDSRFPELKTDYDRMREMFFSEPPKFDEIIERLTPLESTINAMVSERLKAQNA